MQDSGAYWVVADIGGTNARFARVDPTDLSLHQIEQYRCEEFSSLEDVVRAYLSQLDRQTPEAICLAVPGVVERDHMSFPNNHWELSQKEMRASLNTNLSFINDFTAQLYATFTLKDDELHWVDEVRPHGGFVRAAIGPGTGLGVKALTPNGGLVPSEGGHFAWAPLDAHESEVLQLLWRRFERVSVERLCSGPGLSLLYWANSILAGREAELPPEEVSDGAVDGDAICQRAVADFINVLGSTAGDLALILGAHDGVYLMGDLLRKLAPLYDVATLRARFNDKGRFERFCSEVPLALVQAEYTGLRGCAEALRRKKA